MKYQKIFISLRNLSCYLCLLFISNQANATSINISTTSLIGQTGEVAFDFIGGGAPNNSFTLTNFDFGTGSSVASTTQTGGVSGNISSNIFFNDSSFFNELLVNLTFGNNITFDITNATNLAPDSSSFPDAFSVFLLDSAGQSLLSTSDPTGADSIIRWDSGNSPATNIFSQSVTVQESNAVPEPNIIYLLFAGLSVLSFFSKRNKMEIKQ
jgi:hypothetical protein